MGFIVAGALAALVAILLAITGSSTARRWLAGMSAAHSRDTSSGLVLPELIVGLAATCPRGWILPGLTGPKLALIGHWPPHRCKFAHGRYCCKSLFKVSNENS